MKSIVLDSSLLIRHDIGNMPRINESFIRDKRWRAHVASQILIYDQLVIPTHDFGVVAALVNWLGYECFIEALEADTFRFVKPQDLLGYAGNGVGISGYTVSEGGASKPMQWWQIALFKEPGSAIEAQLSNLCRHVPALVVPQLVEKVLPKCSSTRYDNDTFMKYVVNETYLEIRSSDNLRNLVLRLAGGRIRKIDLKRIPGLELNQMRMGIRDSDRDAIDLVLRIAEFHRDLLIAANHSNADIYVPTGAERLITQKISRLSLNQASLEGLTKLLDLNCLPNVEEAVSTGKVSLEGIWRLRQGRKAREFREWLRSASTEDARELERLFVATLSTQPWISSTPSRILRFVMTTASGLLGPLGSAVVGAVDSFFVERLLQGYNPKLFLDQYRDLFEP